MMDLQTIASYFVIAVFVGWFSLTVLYQVYQQGWVAKLKLYDFVGILPYYRVFDRSVKDLKLLYRTGPLSPWKQYPLQRKAGPFCVLWAPEAHEWKALWRYLRTVSDFHHQNIELSIQSAVFHGLANLVHKNTDCENRFQFRIDEGRETIYCSNYLGPG